MKRLFFIACFFSLAVAVCGQSIVCDTVHWFFDIDKSKLSARAIMKELDQKGWLKREHVTITIAGFTDCPGSTAHNQTLSEKRALVAAGLFPPTRFPDWTITHKGYGEAGCSDSDNAYDSKKRRTDIILCAHVAEMPPPVVPAEKEVPVVTETPPGPPALDKIIELKVGETIVLEGLNFIGGRHIPVRRAEKVLEKLLQIMKDNPTLEIQVQGHICCSPSPNQDGQDFDTGVFNLSWSRAEYVRDYLVKNGIDPARLSHKGFAFTKPLYYPETSPEQEDANRRVEVMVVAK